MPLPSPTYTDRIFIVRPYKEITMSERSYYICQFYLSKMSYFIIWYSDEQDGLLLDHSGKIASFGTLAHAKTYAKKNGISIIPKPVPVYNFDVISTWCLKPLPDLIKCELFLNTWNMFSDVAATIGSRSIFATADRGLYTIYDKLFYGNNLPAITPEGMSYVPEWSTTEAEEIAKIFKAGLQDLYGSLRS